VQTIRGMLHQTLNTFVSVHGMMLMCSMENLWTLTVHGCWTQLKDGIMEIQHRMEIEIAFKRDLISILKMLSTIASARRKALLKMKSW
jgi:hypothetical protein